MSEITPISSIYFFAYGSCMNQQSLSRTIGSDSRVFFVAAATLPHHRLCFNYTSLNEPVCCANIVPELDHNVQGALYRIPTDLISNIDRREGVHLQRYQRQWVSVMPADGQECIAVTYFAIVTQALEAAPSKRYQQLLVEGADDTGLSIAYKTDLLLHMAKLPARELEGNFITTRIKPKKREG